MRKQPAPILIWQNIWPTCNLLLLLSLIHTQYTPFLVHFFEFKLLGIDTVWVVARPGGRERDLAGRSFISDHRIPGF